MTKKEEVKTVPAGKNDNVDITYTYFASDRENLKTGEGKNFDNDILLKSFGFEEDKDGTMKMRTYKNELRLDKENNKIERIGTDGKVLSVASVNKNKMAKMLKNTNTKTTKRTTKKTHKDEEMGK